MVKERISMRKIKEVIRLHKDAGLKPKKISIVVDIGRTTVQEYILRFKASNLPWPLPINLSDEELESRLFPKEKQRSNRPKPDFNCLIEEIRRPDATLAVLWEEYKQQHADGYQYAHFCDLFKAYSKRLNYSMRQEHKAGEKTFLDFGDSPIKIIDGKTGLETSTKIFVSVWGASNYMFGKSCYDEKLATWIKLNMEALEYFGCCSKAMVPDNLRSAVSKASRYEPDINPTYAEFAEHYGTVIFPARPHRPKDKPKAENGIKLAKRWILFRLRDQKFYSMDELNQAIAELLDRFNNKTMKKFKKSRREMFELLDKPHALKLPDTPYEFAEWKKVKAQFNYHICYDNHNYSIPYTFTHKELEVKARHSLIEVYYRGQRICSHVRNRKEYGYTTVAEHMPKDHQKYLEWTPERILQWAEKYGQSVKGLVQSIMDSRKFPEQAYRSCLGIIRLENKYSAERLNNACRRALEYRAYSYSSVVNILQKGLDKQKTTTQISPVFLDHENIRGSNYYLENMEGIKNVYANYN